MYIAVGMVRLHYILFINCRFSLQIWGDIRRFTKVNLRWYGNSIEDCMMGGFIGVLSCGTFGFTGT